jgi:maltooligosyltrehalose synthase
VYRAYLSPEGATDDPDARLIRDAAARAADDVPQVAEVLDLLARVLVGEESPSDQRAADLRLRFCPAPGTRRPGVQGQQAGCAGGPASRQLSS